MDWEAAKEAVWIPAHTSEDEVAMVRLGNGVRLTAMDRFGNVEADRLAKLAVEEHRVPESVRAEAKRQEELLYDTAKWLGQVTMVAGSRKDGGPTMDATASRKRANEVARPRGVNGVRRRASRVASQKLVALGCHRLVRDGPKWQCRLCKERSKHWSRLAGQQCKGSVAKKWALNTQEVVSTGAQLVGGRNLFLTGSVIWCSICGAFSDGSVKSLTRPCSGPHTGQGAQDAWLLETWARPAVQTLEGGAASDYQDATSAADQHRSSG